MIMNPTPIDLLEVISSQIPALALLQNMGYAYITPAEALAYRQGKRSKVIRKAINYIISTGKIPRIMSIMSLMNLKSSG